MREEEFRRAVFGDQPSSGGSLGPYTHTFSVEWAQPRGWWDARRRFAAWRRKRSTRHWVDIGPQVRKVTGDRPPLQEPDGGRRGD